MDSKSFIYANGRDGLEENVIDFNLFDAESDRMITLVERDSEYFLQLRSIGGLRVIHEINIEMKAVILEYKLVGNIKWGFTFALAGKVEPYRMYTEDGLLYQYKV